MIGLVLVTHGRLAVEFRSALEHVVGPQGQIEAVTSAVLIGARAVLIRGPSGSGKSQLALGLIEAIARLCRRDHPS